MHKSTEDKIKSFRKNPIYLNHVKYHERIAKMPMLSCPTCLDIELFLSSAVKESRLSAREEVIKEAIKIITNFDMPGKAVPGVVPVKYIVEAISELQSNKAIKKCRHQPYTTSVGICCFKCGVVLEPTIPEDKECHCKREPGSWCRVYTRHCRACFHRPEVDIVERFGIVDDRPTTPERANSLKEGEFDEWFEDSWLSGKFDSDHNNYEPMKKHIKSLLQKRTDEIKAKSFEYMEECEPDCSEVRHARHKGSWEHYRKLDQFLEELE